MRKKIYDLIKTSGGKSKLGSVYDTFMMVAIVASLVPLAFKTEYAVFLIVDKFCAAIFIADYLLRLITADYKYEKCSVLSFLRYPFSPMAVIDLISILPSFAVINNSFKVLRVLRMTRMLRILRVFKVVRYSKSIRIIGDVLKRSKTPLIAVGTLAVAYIVVSALVIINVEPDSFNSFFDAIYWATVSLTTVGYGDIYPVTTAGRLVTMTSSVFGIAIVALPAGIITAGYMQAIESEEQNKD